MTVMNIRTVPDPVLKRKARRVSIIDDSVKTLIGDMLETVHAVPGRAGLAAPQVGISLRVMVIDVPGSLDVCLVNPEILKKSGERVVEEGCLSLPGYFGEIKRAEKVVVRGRDRSGALVRIKGEGLLAQALEHEIDHLNGILYVDHLESPDHLHKIEPESAPAGTCQPDSGSKDQGPAT